MSELLNKVLSRKGAYTVIQTTIIASSFIALFYYTIPRIGLYRESPSRTSSEVKVQDLEIPEIYDIPLKKIEPIGPPPKPKLPDDTYSRNEKERKLPPITRSQVEPESITGESGVTDEEGEGVSPPAPTTPPPSLGVKPGAPKPGVKPGAPKPEDRRLLDLVLEPVPPKTSQKSTIKVRTKAGDTVEIDESKFLELISKNRVEGAVIVVERDKSKRKMWDTELPFWERVVNLMTFCSPFLGALVSVIIWRKNRRLQRLTQEKIDKVIEIKKD
jgi:hypothetical protein